MFAGKEKEPQLSPVMAQIVENSLGADNGSNTDEILRMKKKIMQILVSNKDILNTLHSDKLKPENGDAYRNVHIFDYMFLPELKEKVNNYICFEVNSKNPAVYDTQIQKQIFIRTVCHQDDIKTDWGISRQDLLASIIKTEFDWSNVLGLKLTQAYDVGLVSENNYYYREICFIASSPNNIYNKNYSVYE